MALCISRKENQSFTVGEAIITITQVQGKQVKVAIDAPKEIRVLRRELVKSDG